MPSLYIVLVCGVCASRSTAQSKDTLEKVFGDRFPEARIIVFDGLRSDSNHLSQTGWVWRAADDLLQLLKEEVGLLEKSIYRSPILFLAENVGGIVLKQALIEAMRDWRYQDFVWRTTSLFFFGTLHRVDINSSIDKQFMRLVLATEEEIPDPLIFIAESTAAFPSVSAQFSQLLSMFSVVNFIEDDEKVSVVGKFSSTFGHAAESNVAANCSYQELWHFAPGDPKTDRLWGLIQSRMKSEASEVEYSIFMQALAERDPGTHLDGVTAQREHPTMRWIASHSIYLEWLASSAPAFLHLHGKPGSGSSAVSGVIMEEVAAIPDFQDATFVRFNSHKQYIQTSETARILLSLCRQILSANPKLFRRTKPLCRTMRADNLFNKSAAWGLFQSLLNFHSGPLFICLDGIHNLPPDFLEYLSTIKSLKQESGEPPRFLVTSSSETLPIFPDSLKSTIATLSLSDEADMKRATKQAVQRRVLDVAWRNVLWYDLQETIIKTVCHDLPPYLVAMQSLDLLDVSTPHSTEAAFYFKLEHLPSTLDGLYSHYIAILSRWERQVLGCIVTAVQPLRSVELAICLSLQGEETQSWRDLRSRTSQDIIKDILAHKKIRHLVKVRDDRVYPIYETLTDYLHTKHKQVSKQLHLSMLKACIKYISDLYHDTSFLLGLTSTPELGSNITQDATLSKEAGFLRYASLCWPDHYNLCHGDPQAYRTVSQLLGNPALRSTWFSLYAHFKSHLPENLESLTSPLAMANKLGLTLIVDDMIRGAIPGGDHSKTTWSNPLADSSISSRMPWADTLEVKHQLVQEVITFAVEEGRAELIFQLTSVLSPDTLEIKGHKGLTPLLSATRNGHMDVVNALVKQGASSKATGRDGSTILHLATRLGSLSIVKRILEINSQLDIGAMNNEGYDAIKIAAESGFTTILEELLHRIDPETRKKLVNTPLPSSSQTPLFLAARHGHSEVVKLLLKHKADPGIHNDGESSALYQAAKEGDSDVFTALLTHPMYQKLSIHPQVIGPFNDADGESSIASDDLDACLLVAARYGRVPILKKLLEYKVRVNVTGEGKNTALHLAAREGFEQATTLLLKQHCEVDLRNEERLTPIQLAAQNGHIGVVRTLHKEGKANIARGPDPEPPLSFRSALSTLEMAAMEGQVPVVEYLLVMDPASAPRALQLAAENGQTAVVRYLMANQDQISVSVAWDDAAWIEAAGAALKKRHLEVLRELLTFKLSGVGETGLPAISQEFYHLLYMAIEYDYGPEVQVLAEKGFDMNKPNVKNEHPLHLAVKWNSPNVIVPLVKGGSSLGHIDDTKKDTPLYRAVAQNHAEQVVHELLEAGADPNWKNLGQEDRTPLHQACSVSKDNSSIITCLLDHRADALARDDDGWTPLHYTTNKFSLPNAIALVGVNRERTHLIEIRNNYQSTPLVLAAENGAVDVMEFFLECGADPMLTNKTGSSALHRAAGGAHLDAVKLLIENRFKTADPTMSKANGITALHMAIHNSVPQLEMVEYLLSRDGVDINAQSSNFGSPLCAAARFYSTGYFTPKGDGLKLCKLLMERGADVNSTGGWMYSPLHIAAEHGSAELVELLLSRDDTNVDIFWEEHGTPLSVAILHEHETVVGILLQRGADLNIPLDGETAVQLAVRTGDSGVVKTLLEKRLEKFQVVQGLEDALWAAVRKDMPQAVKALLAERSKDPSSIPDTIIQGWTILTYAIYWDSDEVIGYLLDNPEQHDANIDHHNDAGNAPLHMAIEKGADELLGQLLDHKAEPNICDRVGRTPLMLSAKKADLEVMDMLISKGGNVLSKDLRLRDALYWACLSQSSDAVTKIVAVMQNKGSEWLTSCSAAIFPVIHASEARQNLLEALFKGEDMTARKEVLAGIAMDRNNWTLAYTLKHSHTPSVTSDTDFLPGWFVEYAQEAADKNASSTVEPNTPSRWDDVDAGHPLEVSPDGQTVTVGPKPLMTGGVAMYALIRADYCIPAHEDYQFEVTVNDPVGDMIDESGPFPIGIGLCTEKVDLNQMIGWESGSLGYHGDDGKMFLESEWGRRYADGYGVNDTIVCKVKVGDGQRKVSFLKNNKPLGTALEGDDVPRGQLYPAISMKSSLKGLSMTARFGNPSDVMGPGLLLTPDIQSPGRMRHASPSPAMHPDSPGVCVEEVREDEVEDGDSDYSW